MTEPALEPASEPEPAQPSGPALDIPPEYAQVWVAELDDRGEGRIRWQIPRRRAAIVNYPGPTFDAGSLASELGCDDAELAGRIPKAFAGGGSLALLDTAGGRTEVVVKQSTLDCKAAELTVVFDVPASIGDIPRAYGDFRNALVIAPATAAAKARLVLDETPRTLELRASYVPAVREPLARATAAARTKYHAVGDDIPDEQLEQKISSGNLIAWQVPSAGVVAFTGASVETELSPSEAGFGFEIAFARKPDGTMRTVGTPTLTDGDSVDLITNGLGSIDLDGDGDQELVLGMLTLLDAAAGPNMETRAFGYDLIYYDDASDRFVDLALNGERADSQSEWQPDAWR